VQQTQTRALNVHVPQRLHEALRILSSRRRRTLRELVAEILADGLRREGLVIEEPAA
jgi:hypothetical protein